MVQEVEAFFGVYLLYNLNPKYKGRIYIGKTTDPNRRIYQHNTGTKAGGAWKTDGKGPWEMVLIIHGFPEAVSALRFEWAWQHPKISRRLRHVPAKRKSEKSYDFHFRLVSEMLRTAPWNRLALTIRLLHQEFRLDFSPTTPPPNHMPIEFGPITCKKVGNKKKKKTNEKTGDDESESESFVLKFCDVCYKSIQKEDIKLSCLHPECSMTSHIICLARVFLGNDDHVIPIDGQCPKCNSILMWGELVRQSQGCHTNLQKERENEFTSEYDEDTE